MVTAYVLINSKVGSEIELLNGLKSIEAIEEARVVMGEYDVIAKLTCDTMHELKNYINLKLRYLDNVISTMTLMAV
jgi:DNA-binding Lrp family transcriptional regulator